MTSILKKAALGLALAAAIGHGAAAAPQSEAESALTGTWLGEFRPSSDQPLQRFLTRRRADGTFEIMARLYDPQKPVQEVVNSGLWGVSNGLYFTVTTVINGQKTDVKSPDTVNSYVVQSLQPGEFAYRHVLSGYNFQVRKVPDDTRLP
jgi:hypothetical protein